jgi:predicted glycoside hydrolase/deacetylase ChbG (UPF0249 family)
MGPDAATARAARRWVVCADDFALDRGSIEATLALIKLGRVTATSALVDSPNWKAAAPELKAVADQADVGLHLNLTQALDRGSARWPVPSLVVQSVLRIVPRWRLRNLVDQQLDSFSDAFGRLPEPKSLPWLRNCLPPDGDEDYKARVIGMLGSDALAELAQLQGFPVSRCLVGVYGFNLQRSAYLAKVRQWLQAGCDGSVFMCHPSTRASPKDPIGTARRVELGVLAGDAYADALSRAGVSPVRGTAIFKAPPTTLKPAA